MDRSLSGLAALALGIGLLAPAGAFAATPAAFGPAVQVDTQDPDPCVAMYGLAKCDRPGGFAAKGQKAVLITWDGEDVVQHLSTDGGATWGGAGKIDGGGTMPVLAQDGDLLAYGYRADAGPNAIRAGWGFAVGELDSPGDGFDEPRQVTTEIAADVENGLFVWAAAGYDEVPQGRKGNAIRILRKTDGIGSPPVTRTLAWSGPGCLPTGTDASIAVTGEAKIVLAYWQTCDKLVIRRTNDLAKVWSAPVTLSTRTHGHGMAIEAEGKTVVLAYSADGTTWVRRSTDNGRTWSAPRSAGSGATSLRLSYAGGRSHLLAGGTTSIRYRSSADGSTWSPGQTVDSLQGAKTYALGVAVGGGKVRAAYSIRQAPTTYGLFVSPR